MSLQDHSLWFYTDDASGHPGTDGGKGSEKCLPRLWHMLAPLRKTRIW
jgi:hypothetical protein